ncbi:MAG TPA: peptidase S8 [Lachnospiraceae bacterium]|nr:peptidase S8 [Lachnospiraceae bacterium]
MTNQKLETALELALSVPSSVRAKSPSLEAGYSPETQSWELIIRYSGDLVLPEDVTLVSLFGGYGILYLPENRINEISALPQIEYIEKPKRLSFSLAGAKSAACIPPVTRPPKNLTGENVLIGIIDSGIDIYHPDFRNEDGTTRIVNLWDQTLGQVFSEEEINAALLADDGTFPSKDLSGHGTHVAGIAAGNGRASGGLYAGVATKSRLIVVKLGNLLPDAFPRTTELMTALDYCVRRSLELQMPLSLNLSFGNNYGSHTGFSLLETYLDTIATIGRTTIAVGTGNEGNLGRHASDTLSQMPISRELSVAPGETSLNIQLWKDFSDEFQIRLTAPSGESIFLNENYIGAYQARLDNTDLYWFFGEPSPYQIFQEIYVEMLPPAGQQTIAEGLWTWQLIPVNIQNGRFDLWLPSSASINPQTRFLVADPETSLTIPSTAFRPITVAAYDSNANQLASFSGQGFTALSLTKPDLAAPGVNITSASVGGGYNARSGTSMATPFVTGSAALLMQYGIIQGNDPFLYGQKIKAWLIRGARPLPALRTYPNPQIGWGVLCLNDSIF